MTARAAVALAVALAASALAAGAAAAPQPREAPPDFRNGQSNAFGSVAMEPYVPAGGGEASVQARFALRDLDVLERAANVMLAFNLHSGDTSVVLERVTTADGRSLEPVRSAAARGGLQQQAFLAPADVLGAARGGAVELVLSGRVEASANGQWHVGALAIAFDAAWATLRTPDGRNAELYGFSLVMATGVPMGLGAPFHGQGNTWAVAPFLVLAVAAIGAGGYTLAGMARAARPPAAAAPSGPLPADPAPAPAPAPSAAASPSPPPVQPPAPPPAPAVPAQPAAPAVPVFGSPASPAGLPPVQGPKLPPGFVPRPWPAAPAAAPAMPTPAGAAPEEPQPRRPGRPARRRASPRAAAPAQANR